MTMPKEISLDLCFTNEQVEQMKRGLIPEVMEDKWFIYHNSDWLYFHRSWTGFGIYKAKLVKIDEGYAINSFWAERNPEKYSNEDDNEDRESIIFLISQGLLGLNVSDFYADSNVNTPQDAVKMWSHFGKMLFGNSNIALTATS
jgi:hypothetical protein